MGGRKTLPPSLAPPLHVPRQPPAVRPRCPVLHPSSPTTGLAAPRTDALRGCRRGGGCITAPPDPPHTPPPQRGLNLQRRAPGEHGCFSVPPPSRLVFFFGPIFMALPPLPAPAGRGLSRTDPPPRAHTQAPGEATRTQGGGVGVWFGFGLVLVLEGPWSLHSTPPYPALPHPTPPQFPLAPSGWPQAQRGLPG